MSSSRIFVTGCNGFVGGSVGRFAARNGWTVAGADRGARPELDWPGTYHRSDLAKDDIAELLRAFKPGIVFHGAGTASVADSFERPLADLRSSTQTLARVLDAIRVSRIRPFVVFPSSAAVYGNPKSLPVSETAPLAPISPYGYHKLLCETIAQEYRTCFDIRSTALRIFSTFGPRQRRLLVWELYQQAAGDAPELTLMGSGEETRDYLHVDDVARVALALSSHGAPPHVLNCASGCAMTTRDVAEHVRRITGSTKPIVCLNRIRQGDPIQWQADITEMRRTTEVSPTSFLRGLEVCIATWAHTTGGVAD